MSENKKGKLGWHGEYKFVNYVDVPGRGSVVLAETDWMSNIVTNAGRTLLSNRIAANTYSPINAIALGTGTTVPRLSDTVLATEKLRKATSYSVVGTPDWKTIFNATFNASEVNGVTEIGLINSTTTGGTLATRSIFASALSIPLGSNLGIAYALIQQIARIETAWALANGQTKTYVHDELDPVKCVIELDTGYGYNKKTSIAAVESAAGSYYYDSGNSKLYVHTSDDASPVTAHQVEVMTGG